MSGIKTSFNFDVTNFAQLQMVAPKEKSELEKAKEEAEARAKKKAEEELNNTGPGQSKQKNTKKVGFATSSNMGFSNFGGTSEVVMRTRPILSDEHE